MPCRSVIPAAAAVLALTTLAASSAAAAYVSTWDSGVGQAWHDHSNGSGGYSNWKGSPNNPPAEIIAGAVLICPTGYILGPDHHWCWPH